MEHTNDTRTPGAWLAAGALLLITSLIMHGPPPSDTAAFMELIAEQGGRWILVHWLAAAALTCLAVAGLTGLSVARGPLARSAWAVMAVGAFATAFTAVAEATAIADLAERGDLDAFAPWQHFAEGTAMGFALVALAVAGIAATEARHRTAGVPTWSAGAATVAGMMAFTGWILVSVFGVGPGGLVWLVGSLVTGAWLVWYGIGLARVRPAQATRGPAHA